MNILDVRWFNAVGIVKIKDRYDGIKYYIGVGDGKDIEIDKQFIADWGSHFPTSAGNKLFEVT